MKKLNQDLRDYIQKKGHFYYEVALELGCSENTMYRLLRSNLTQEKKQRIIKAVDRLDIKKNQLTS